MASTSQKAQEQILSWPDRPETFVSAPQVAAYLGYNSLTAFYRDKPWRDKHGFPPQPMKRRWRAGQIETWLAARERGHTLKVYAANDTGPTVTGSATARDKIDHLWASLQGTNRAGQ